MLNEFATIGWQFETAAEKQLLAANVGAAIFDNDTIYQLYYYILIVA
jgi:hypothetical protein